MVNQPYLHAVNSFERQTTAELAWNPDHDAESLLESFTVSVQNV